MFRWARRIVGGLVLLAVVVAAPIVWVEGVCATSPTPRPRPRALVDDRGYARRESDSYLSFPEWHIVYAYEDLAGVLRRGSESDFAYGQQIAGFWSSLCTLTRVVTAREPVATDTKIMLYTIGWSFTAELALKGAYEKSVGRLFEWLRGAGQDGRGQLRRARHASLRRVPAPDAVVRVPVRRPGWRHSGAARRWTATHLSRKLERRGLVTLEYGTKAVYGAVIGYASATALGAADLEIQSVVVGLDASRSGRRAPDRGRAPARGWAHADPHAALPGVQ